MLKTTLNRQLLQGCVSGARIRALHSNISRCIFFVLKATIHIALRLALALLLVIGTAGLSVHQHFCSMKAPSASIEARTPCCGIADRHVPDSRESVTAVPCCNDELQTNAVDQHFDVPASPRGLVPVCAALPATVMADIPVAILPQPAVEDISPHILLSLAETVNHLRS